MKFLLTISIAMTVSLRWPFGESSRPRTRIHSPFYVGDRLIMTTNPNGCEVEAVRGDYVRCKRELENGEDWWHVTALGQGHIRTSLNTNQPQPPAPVPQPPGWSQARDLGSRQPPDRPPATGSPTSEFRGSLDTL